MRDEARTERRFWHTDSMTGIDISADQGDDVPGAWDFIVVKLSEGLHIPNFRFDRQWANAARTTRGAYHYGRPLVSPGRDQANFFSNMLIQRGFQAGKDIWQLDAEDGENAGISGTTWRVFINDFMTVATQRLGARGFLYAGFPFLATKGLLDLPYRWMWWLTDYGPNNSATDHGIMDVPAADRGLVVIHQFTSFGGLDQNKILNPIAYTQGVHQVLPRFSPALGIVDVLTIPNVGTWGLGDDGGVFTFAGNFHGSAAGKSYFAGRHGARLVVPGTEVPGANPPQAHYDPACVYEVIATSGERYAVTP